ncbi:DUF1127 domain-containing protein [Nitratireductor luteus]|uniref:DUF1127 domain-containing protein n=1 Tax=Nitratireductor luteus TaxID=2976980 RepID=UPI0022408AAE|nr:DUF1127 domain-containing protein [Nitratireductor luteus]
MQHTARNPILALPARLRVGAVRVVACLTRMADRRRQRLHLAELDDHQLADIGLTRCDVERECAKPFWRTDDR